MVVSARKLVQTHKKQVKPNPATGKSRKPLIKDLGD